MKNYTEFEEQSDSCSFDEENNDGKYDASKSYLDFGLVDYQS